MSHKSHKKNPQLKKVEATEKLEAKQRGGFHPEDMKVPVVVNAPVQEKRLGMFTVSGKMIDHMTFDRWQAFIRNFVIIGCIPDQKGRFVYTAFSPLFEACNVGDKIPHYRIRIKGEHLPDGGETITVKAERETSRKIILPGEIK